MENGDSSNVAQDDAGAKPDVTLYVCGFLFDQSGNVALVLKNHGPAAVVGRWNGIGGKVEPGETPAAAMRREFRGCNGGDMPSAEVAALKDALSKLLLYAERNECHHEETHRGGAIWTICNACNRKWADDRGGFVPYQEPEEIAWARALLERGEIRPTEASR